MKKAPPPPPPPPPPPEQESYDLKDKADVGVYLKEALDGAANEKSLKVSGGGDVFRAGVYWGIRRSRC